MNSFTLPSRAALLPSSSSRRRPSLPSLSRASSSRGSNERIIIGIESSCDDTGIAVITTGGRILGEAVAHQYEIHEAWGGVVPNLAMEAHAAAIDRVFDEALNQASLSLSDIDAVSVTVGPGLSLCLRVGALKARRAAHAARAPIIPINHLEAHVLTARLFGPDGPGSLPFPFVCLLVSGGHNQLLLCRGVGDYVELGATLDDALGEAYDKVARLLGLKLVPSGGAVLEALAREGDPLSHPFTLPLKARPTADFSFSGLKTAVREAIEVHVPEVAAAAARCGAEGRAGDERAVREALEAMEGEEGRGGMGLRQRRANIAASFQKVASDHLVTKVRRGAQWALASEPGCSHLVVAGGVAANTYVRGRLAELCSELGLALCCPPPRYCTDNGLMVAWAGAERLREGLIWPVPSTPAPLEGEWLDLRPRWPLGERDPRASSNHRGIKKKGLSADLTSVTRSDRATLAAGGVLLPLTGAPEKEKEKGVVGLGLDSDAALRA